MAEDTISFRWPSDTPDEVKDRYREIKKELGKGTSRHLAQLLIRSIMQELYPGGVWIPLLRETSKEQYEWVTHKNTVSTIAKIVDLMIHRPFEPIAELKIKNISTKTNKTSENKENISSDIEDLISGLGDFG